MKKHQNGPGYVYIATHPWIDEECRVKIGCTVRTPEERMRQIQSLDTLPEGWKLHKSFKVNRAMDAEKAAHAYLKDRRYKGSEWFDCGDIGVEGVADNVQTILIDRGLIKT